MMKYDPEYIKFGLKMVDNDSELKVKSNAFFFPTIILFLVFVGEGGIPCTFFTDVIEYYCYRVLKQTQLENLPKCLSK